MLFTKYLSLILFPHYIQFLPETFSFVVFIGFTFVSTLVLVLSRNSSVVNRLFLLRLYKKSVIYFVSATPVTLHLLISCRIHASRLGWWRKPTSVTLFSFRWPHRWFIAVAHYSESCRGFSRVRCHYMHFLLSSLSYGVLDVYAQTANQSCTVLFSSAASYLYIQSSPRDVLRGSPICHPGRAW